MEIYIVTEVLEWIESLDGVAHARKELRPGDSAYLFAFDPWRSTILLVAGDKAGRWRQWYEEAIPLAERRYQTYLKERASEEGEPQ